jgi:hypothetical protein
MITSAFTIMERGTQKRFVRSAHIGPKFNVRAFLTKICSRYSI